MGVFWILTIQWISLNYFGAAAITANLPCNFHDSINITDGLLDADKAIQFNGIIFPKDQYAEVDYILVNGTQRIETNSHLRGCPCNIKTCIRLCCPPGKVYDPKLKKKSFGELFKCSNNDKFNNLEMKIRKENGQMEKVNLNEQFSYAIATDPKHYIFGMKWEIVHVRKFFYLISNFSQIKMTKI